MNRTAQRLIVCLLMVVIGLLVGTRLPRVLAGDSGALLGMAAQVATPAFFAVFVWKYDYLLKLGRDGRPRAQQD